MKYSIFIIFYWTVLVNGEDKKPTVRTKNNNDNHINVALETVLEFNKRDQRSDIQLINNVQQFLDKVKNAITPSTTTETYNAKKYKRLKEFRPIKEAADHELSIKNHKHHKNNKREKYEEITEPKEINEAVKSITNYKEMMEKRLDLDIQKNRKNETRFKIQSKPNNFDKLKKKYSVVSDAKNSNVKRVHDDKKKKKVQHKIFKAYEHLDSPKTITDSVLSLASTMQELSDDDLQTIIETADDEISKFRCANCNVGDDTLIRRSMTKGIDVLRRTPLNIIRGYIHRFLEYSKNQNAYTLSELSGAVNLFFGEMEKAIAHIKPKTETQLQQIATDFRNFLRTSVNKILTGSNVFTQTTQAPKKSLIEIVRNAIRTLVFDNYSNLEEDNKNWIKARLKMLMKEYAKPQEAVQESLTNRINNAFKNLLHAFFQGTAYALQGSSTTEKVIKDTTTPSRIANKQKQSKDYRQDPEVSEIWNNVKVKKPKTFIKYDIHKSEVTDPKVLVIGKIDPIKKLLKKKKDRINKNKKIRIDKNWKQYMKRKEKFKNNNNQKEIEDFDYKIDLKWNENLMGKPTPKQKTKNIKPKNPKMKTSDLDYIDEIDPNKENVIDEEDSDDDGEEIQYIQQKLPQSTIRNQNSNDIGALSSWDRRSNIKESLKDLNTREEGLSIEFIKTNNAINKNTDNPMKNNAVNKSTDVFIPQNFDYAGKQVENTFTHPNEEEASNINNGLKSNGLYIPKSRRDFSLQPNIEIIQAMDTHPVLPIQYEFSDKAQKLNIPTSTSVNVKKNYLSTLFTTKAPFYKKSEIKDINNKNTFDNANNKDTYNGRTVVDDKYFKSKEKAQNVTKHSEISNFLIDNMSKLEENFAKYQQIVENEETDDNDEDIDKKAKKSNITLSSTTFRPKMPSTVDILKRINPEEAIDRYGYTNNAKIDKKQSKIGEDIKSTEKKLSVIRRQDDEYSDLY